MIGVHIHANHRQTLKQTATSFSLAHISVISVTLRPNIQYHLSVINFYHMFKHYKVLNQVSSFDQHLVTNK